MPALRALRRAFPGHDLVLVAPAALAPLVRLADVADRLVDHSGLAALDAALAWDGAPPDVAVNLHGRGPESHRLLQALSPRRLVGFGSASAGVPGPAWRADEHEVRRWCRLVSVALAVPADPADLRISRPAEEPAVPGAVVVHPGAAYPSRRWPVERYAEVARVLSESGLPVVVTGGPSEVVLAEELARQSGLPPESVLAGRTDLAGLAAQVASASLVVCGDTGVAHLASAYATRSVVLFGPVSPALWGPPPEGPHTVLWQGDGTGDPWGDQPDPALLRIDVDEVVRAALGCQLPVT